MPEVRLRAMTREEYASYVDRSIEGYAEAMVRAGRIDADKAHDLSVASFERILPDGYDTAGQVLLVAEDAASGEAVGLLWFGPSSDDERRAWIYDIEVEEARRGQGWGRATLAAFEPAAREHGFTSAGLNVYGDNVVARGLYEAMGYTETARQMAKSL